MCPNNNFDLKPIARNQYTVIRPSLLLLVCHALYYLVLIFSWCTRGH